jgi:hypothetical protein
MSATTIPLESDVTLTPIADEDRAAPKTRSLRGRHRTMLCLAVLIIVAAFTMQIHDSSAVTLPWLNIELPTLCGSRALFGIDCPGCGLTRSFIALAAGDLRQSVEYHRLGWLLALAVVVQIPYRLYSLWELKRGVVQRTWPIWFGNFLILALILNWLLKMTGR